MYVTSLRANGQEVAITHTCWSLQGRPWVRTANGCFHLLRVETGRNDSWNKDTHESAEVEIMAENPPIEVNRYVPSLALSPSVRRRSSFYNYDW